MTPPWLASLAPLAGPFVPAAITFATARGTELLRGREGLRALARTIDVFMEDEATEEEDRHFVEGAGATLAVLLLDHLGSGRHRERNGAHRLQLGAHGFFDPFSAIEAVIDAEAPRSELARQVEQAEAEARGEGPIAATARLFDSVLGERHPDLRVVDRFDLEVTLAGGIRIDLARIARIAPEDASSRRHAAIRLLSFLPNQGEGPPPTFTANELLARVLPRPVGRAFLSELQEDAVDRLLHFPIGDALSLALILDFGDRARYLRTEELVAVGVPPDAARTRSLENLARRSERARLYHLDEATGPLVVAESGDGLDAARLFLPTLHAVLRNVLATPIVAAIPHRDRLVATAANDLAAVERLRSLAADENARAPHPISRELYLVTERGPEPFESSPNARR